MRHVPAALTAPPATILHERALVTRGSAERIEFQANEYLPVTAPNLRLVA